MNIAVTIFYSIAGAYLVGMLAFSIYKRIKLKKAKKNVIEESEKVDEQEGK